MSTRANRKADGSARTATPKHTDSALGAPLTLVNAGLQNSENEDPNRQLHAIFERVFKAFRSFEPDGHLLIGQCSALSHACRIELACGQMEHLARQTLDVSRDPFAKLLTGTNTVLLASSAELAKSEPAFARLGKGSAALLRVDLAGDLVAILLYWQPASQGELSNDRVEALKLISELAGEAACASDLTLDVQAQQLHLDTLRTEIEEVQQFYRQFSDEIRQCFWVLDLDSSRVLVVSDNFEKVWGADRAILYEGLNGFMANVFPADRDRVLSEFHTHLNTRLGEEMEIELRVIGPEGEVHWIWLRVYRTGNHLDRDLQNTTPPPRFAPAHRIVMIADDITEKKTEEERLRAREADLVARAHTLAVADLASGVAHEINNPLTIIVGKAAEIAREVGKPNHDPSHIRALAEKVQKTSIRISEIISSLKSLAQQEEFAVSYPPSSLSRVFHDLHDMCSERFKAAGIHLGLATPKESDRAEINVTLISQMLLNLLNNSFDAVQNEKEKWVSVDLTTDEHSVYIFVTDSGPGIPIKMRSRIFDPFFTTKEPGRGTGLGLTLAASVAAHHNGLLRLDHMHPHTRFVAQIPKKHKNTKASRS